MPPRGKRKSASARRAEKTKSLASGESVDDYRHGDKRKNIPGSGQADFDTAPVERKKYAYDPHLDPQLVWAGKAERTSFEVDTVSLHIHERISTQAILRAAQSRAVQRMAWIRN
jgi:adenine-specific DNA-methyltransferase